MDPFATLGLPRRYQLDMPQLETNYRELQRVLHPDRHNSAAASQRRMNLLKAVEVNEAYRALKNDLTRAEALLALYAAEAPPEARPEARQEDPEFLMEVLELREELSEAHAAGDAAAVRAMADRALGAKLEINAALGTSFEALSRSTSTAELASARKLLGRLKYFHRFLDEVSTLEERTQERG
jgi:molecular chaperone HscB